MMIITCKQKESFEDDDADDVDDDNEHDEAGDARRPGVSLQGGGVSWGIPQTQTAPAKSSPPTGAIITMMMTSMV